MTIIATSHYGWDGVGERSDCFGLASGTVPAVEDRGLAATKSRSNGIRKSAFAPGMF